ncbi:hypothetical protein HYQ46_010896 [Verticillium longisporum]|nr:hypothetical protein HYQ46_010896 [Verticillium longisporum]
MSRRSPSLPLDHFEAPESLTFSPLLRGMPCGEAWDRPVTLWSRLTRRLSMVPMASKREGERDLGRVPSGQFCGRVGLEAKMEVEVEIKTKVGHGCLK